MKKAIYLYRSAPTAARSKPKLKNGQVISVTGHTCPRGENSMSVGS